MGVIRKLGNGAPVISFSDESINSLGISQPSTPSEPEQPVSSATDHNVPQVFPQRNQLLHRLEHFRSNRHRGARKSRRVNNTHELQTLIEDDTENDVDIYDLQPRSESAFTRLFNDCDNMRVWQYFITLDEKDQAAYLDKISATSRNVRDAKKQHGFSFTMMRKELQEVQSDGFTVIEAMSECENLHPAFNANQRYGSLDKNLQAFLARRHLPLGLLCHLEQELIDVFCGDPKSVYISQDMNGLGRLLLHAISQYNGLTSKSATIAGKRRTKIENPKNCFHSPDPSLSAYIEKTLRGQQ